MPQQNLVWQDDKLATDAPPEVVERALQEAKTAKKEVDAQGHAVCGPLIWHDVEGDPSEYLDELARIYGFSALTLDTLRDEHAITKLRQAASGYFHLIVHTLGYNADTEEATTPKLDLLFGPGFLVSVHCEPLSWLTDLRESIVAGTTEENIMSRGVAYLLYVVLDTLVDSYFPVLDTLDDVVDELEDAAVTETSNQVQARLFRVKRTVVLMRRVISPQVEVCNALVTRTGEVIPQPMEPYFSTVHDHMVRAFEVLDSYRDLLSGLLDVYLTTVSNRLNDIMKQLTIIAAIFLPISFVTGVFGQNFAAPPQVTHDNGYYFWYALLLMALITGGQLWYFWRRGWI
jgi:magnesium transporter